MNEIQAELARVAKLVFGVDAAPEVALASGQKFSDGRPVDFASNLALQLAKDVHQSPRDIAETLKNALELDDFEVEIAAPGFLNFIASEAYFLRKLTGLVDNFPENISSDAYSGQTVVCEFSDPNPFKVLHVGHLYTSIVGDAISRLFEYAGAKVIRANFGGDVGLHVAKNLYFLKDRGEELQNLKTLDEKANLMADCYVKGTQAYDEDEVARKAITKLNKEIYQINQEDIHEGELAEMYWRGREASYKYFKDFYRRLGIEFDKYYPESTVAGEGLKQVRAHTDVYTESDGAIVFRGEDYGLHTRVFINREGLPTYEAKDVGLLFTKYTDFHFDKSVVITGSEQKDYMAVVLKSVEQYAADLVQKTTHLTHGMVRLPGNEKMSSRKGNFLRATDVLDLTRAALSENSGSETNAETNNSASADGRLTLAAIKYAFLKSGVGGDIEFDAKKSVSTTGNSGIYLEYSLVRAKKILAKGANNTPAPGWQMTERERALVKKLAGYQPALDEALAALAPNKLCAYLYELAQEFSRFYEVVPVAGSDFEAERLRLVQAYANVLTHGLNLLGISPVEEM